MKINKMENSVAAAISLVMVSVGFLHGMAVSRFLGWVEADELKSRLLKEADIRVALQKTIDDLEDELDEERIEKEELLAHLSGVLQKYKRIPSPEGAARSEGCPCDECDCS